MVYDADYKGPGNMNAELSVFLTTEQAERLLEEPDTELIFHYGDGTRIIVRVTNEAVPTLGENTTVH